MDCLEVLGGRPLRGELSIQGSKNAILPIIAGAVLHRGITVLHNCPHIDDVYYMIEILKELGCEACWKGEELYLDTSMIKSTRVDAKFGGKLRSSIVLLGSLLGRCKTALLSYPGGCTIGTRPIDLHLEGFRQMGAQIIEDGCNLRACTKGLRGGYIELDFPSVGATENLILGAVLADGKTTISGAAKEPEVTELCHFLLEKGADIKGVGTDCLQIQGIKELCDSRYTLSADRIVAGTYLLAAVGTRGEVSLKNAPVEQLSSLLILLKKMGAIISEKDGRLWLDGRQADKPLEVVETGPYPAFPTDLQSPLMAVLSCAKGESRIRETVFEERFQTAYSLNSMGARIDILGQEAYIVGVESLKGCKVEALELRGGAALVIAGLMADGETVIENRHFIERGYEDIGRDLKKLHANVK